MFVNHMGYVISCLLLDHVCGVHGQGFIILLNRQHSVGFVLEGEWRL